MESLRSAEENDIEAGHVNAHIALYRHGFARRWLHRLILRLFCDDHALFFCDRKKQLHPKSRKGPSCKGFYSAI